MTIELGCAASGFRALRARLRLQAVLKLSCALLSCLQQMKNLTFSLSTSLRPPSGSGAETCSRFQDTSARFKADWPPVLQSWTIHACLLLTGYCANYLLTVSGRLASCTSAWVEPCSVKDKAYGWRTYESCYSYTV